MVCSSWTNKLITAKDHASIQINVGNLGEDGVVDGTFATYALRGQVRARVRPLSCCILFVVAQESCATSKHSCCGCASTPACADMVSQHALFSTARRRVMCAQKLLRVTAEMASGCILHSNAAQALVFTAC